LLFDGLCNVGDTTYFFHRDGRNIVRIVHHVKRQLHIAKVRIVLKSADADEQHRVRKNELVKITIGKSVFTNTFETVEQLYLAKTTFRKSPHANRSEIVNAINDCESRALVKRVSINRC
jgi:hypothetical protein